jgi:hypothetical protein
MNQRFLIHSINHTILLVDITSIGLPTEIYPPEGKAQDLLSLRFQTWQEAERFLLRLGAAELPLEKANSWLKKMGLAVLTISD